MKVEKESKVELIFVAEESLVQITMSCSLSGVILTVHEIDKFLPCLYFKSFMIDGQSYE